MTPPGRSSASTRSTSDNSVWSSRAAARPAIPAPTTTAPTSVGLTRARPKMRLGGRCELLTSRVFEGASGVCKSFHSLDGRSRQATVPEVQNVTTRRASRPRDPFHHGENLFPASRKRAGIQVALQGGTPLGPPRRPCRHASRQTPHPHRSRGPLPVRGRHC